MPLTISGMSFDTLKKEVESLADGERRKLLAFMVAIEDRGRQDYPGLLARRIDDHAPEHWRTIDEVERELGLDSGKE